METLADDDALAGDGGEADRFEAEAEAEAELLRDRFRLAVINIATSEGRLKWHPFSTGVQFPLSLLSLATEIGIRNSNV